MYVLTLVSPLQQTDFDVHIRHALDNVHLDDRRVIEQGKAVDWFVETPLSKPQLDDIRTIHRIDIFQQKLFDRPKKLFMADMDATMVRGETLDDMAVKAGIADKIIPITQRAMRGEIDFEQALTERVAMLADMDESIISDTLAETTLTAGGEILLKRLKSAGVYCVLISGGFTQFTGAIAARLGFDAHFGNTLLIENGRLTGAVQPPILGKEAKQNKLEELRGSMNLQSSDICAVGDGANDLPMLQAAGFGVGYYPKPLLAQNLDNIVRYTDLSSLCYALDI